MKATYDAMKATDDAMKATYDAMKPYPVNSVRSEYNLTKASL